jgi:hypothetical protein
MTMRPVLLYLTIAAAACALPGEGSAQSLFSSRGLGFPIGPEDARSRGLGGVAIGLPDFEVGWANPAASVGLQAPGFVLGYQYDNFDAEAAGPGFEGRSARFPLLLGAFPASERIVLQAGFGGFLDQNWVVEQPETLVIGGDTVQVIDRATSAGGVGRFRLGAGYRITDRVGFALAGDLYTGRIERVQGRVFPAPYNSAPQRSQWRYRGVGYTGGVQWSRGADAGAGLAITVGGTLDAEPTDTVAVARAYSLPAAVRAGASGRVGQSTLVALSASWTGWSTLDDALADDGGAVDTWSVGGGVEWDGLLVRDRPIPLRIGARTATLPFRWDALASETPSERAVSFGLGAILAGGAARTDFGFEFGNRGSDAAGLDESFWRFNFSVRVLAR